MTVAVQHPSSTVEMYTVETSFPYRDPYEDAFIYKVESDGRLQSVWTLEVKGGTDWMNCVGGDPADRVMMATTDGEGTFLLSPNGTGWKKRFVVQDELAALRYLGQGFYSAMAEDLRSVVLVDSRNQTVLPATTPLPDSWPSLAELGDYFFDQEQKTLTTLVHFGTELDPGYTTSCWFEQWSWSGNFQQWQLISNATLAPQWNNLTWQTTVVSIAPIRGQASQSLFYCFAYQQNITNIANSPPGPEIYYRCKIDVRTGDLQLLELWQDSNVFNFLEDRTSNNWIVLGEQIYWFDPNTFEIVKSVNASVPCLALMYSETGIRSQIRVKFNI